MATWAHRLSCGRPNFVFKLLLAVGLLCVIVVVLHTSNPSYLRSLPESLPSFPELPSWSKHDSDPARPSASEKEEGSVAHVEPVEPVAPTAPIATGSPVAPVAPKRLHPVEELIEKAFERRDKLLLERSEDVATAAQRYRERRGRHPPPGFDAWFDYAKKHDAMVIEELFDRAYQDLEPFWGIDAHQLRTDSAPSNWDHIITVRNHVAALKSEGVDPMNRLGLWFPLIQELEKHLPDVNIPMNIMDETRVLVPWQEVNKLVDAAAKTRTVPSASYVSDAYKHGLPPADQPSPGIDPRWITGPASDYWNIAKQGCSPELWAPHTDAIRVDADPPDMPSTPSYGTHAGFVTNMSIASDPCYHPHIRSLHGTFIESVSVRTTQQFLPLFGGSKLPMNNDILIPPAMYLSTEELYAGGEDHSPPWAQKNATTVWRGVASGGRNKPETWTHFHRHRFVQMLNGSTVKRAEENSGKGETFTLPDAERYGLTHLRSTNDSLGDWLNEIADVAFTNLECFPIEPEGRRHLCTHADPYFFVAGRIPMSEQYRHKFLIDVDGNSFSGRFRAFLLSTSLPVKATIYSEWHDSRLIPWAHYVPFDPAYTDLYSVLAFFLGKDDSVLGLSSAKERDAEVQKRDRLAERIALEGKHWAEKVLRREDMALYFWRVLLEWARLCDDERANLGWVADLR